MPAQPPNSSRRTLFIILVGLAFFTACGLVLVISVRVGLRSPAGAPQFPSPPHIVLVETQMPRQVNPHAPQPERITGIGIMLRRDENSRKWLIHDTVPKSPAAQAGLQPGTLLEAVNEQPVEDLRMEELVALIRGPAGSKITLHLLNKEMTQTNRVELIRKAIPTEGPRANDLR